MTKHNRRAHLDDYQPTEDGSYTYTGLLWRWQVPHAREAFVREAWSLVAVATACTIGAGFVPAPGVGNAFFVLVPYVISAGCLALTCACVWRITHEGVQLRNHVYASAVKGLPVRAYVGAGAACLSAAGEVFCALAGGGGVEAPLLGVIFALCELGVAVCLMLLARRTRALAFELVS